MKTTHYGLFVALLLFVCSGCEKHSLRSPLSTQKPAASEKTVPTISVVAGSTCGRVVCNVGSGPVIRYNAIHITNNNQAALPSLTYTLYERISANPATGTEVYQPFVQFTCPQFVSTYGADDVNNNAGILVYATNPASAAPSPTANVTLVWGVMTGQLPHSTIRTVTAGNFEGMSCGKN